MEINKDGSKTIPAGAAMIAQTQAPRGFAKAKGVPQPHSGMILRASPKQLDRDKFPYKSIR